MADDEDIRISPAQSAYLKAFDNWLHTSWKIGLRSGLRVDGARELKDACFDLMLEEAGVAPGKQNPATSVPARLRNRVKRLCTGCGDEFVLQTTRGRPRHKCYSCRPARLRQMSRAA